MARPAVAGAVLSTVATIAQLSAVLAATSETTLYLLRIPLLAAGTTALAYGGLLTFVTIRRPIAETARRERAFSLRASLLLAGIIAAVLFVTGALNHWVGERGGLLTAAIAGFADTHSPAFAVASLVAAGKLAASESAMPVLAALTTNTISKVVVAIWSGGWKFAAWVVPGLVLVVAAAWCGLAVTAAR